LYHIKTLFYELLMHYIGYFKLYCPIINIILTYYIVHGIYTVRMIYKDLWNLYFFEKADSNKIVLENFVKNYNHSKFTNIQCTIYEIYNYYLNTKCLFIQNIYVTYFSDNYVSFVISHSKFVFCWVLSIVVVRCIY